LEFHRSGKTRILAVTNPTRLGVAPELATAAESDLSGLTVTGTIGLLAPAGTRSGIIERIAQATRAAVTEPSYQQLLIEAGIEPPPDSPPDKFRRSLAADVALWTPIVKSPRAEDRLTRASLFVAPSISEAKCGFKWYSRRVGVRSARSPRRPWPTGSPSSRTGPTRSATALQWRARRIHTRPSRRCLLRSS